jgi:hypothetical protein
MEPELITEKLKQNNCGDIALEYEAIINRIDNVDTRKRLNILVEHFFLWKLTNLEKRLAELKKERKLNGANQRSVVVSEDQIRQRSLMQDEIEKLHKINEDLLLWNQELMKEIREIREATMNKENRKITRLKELFEDESESIM